VPFPVYKKLDTECHCRLTYDSVNRQRYQLHLIGSILPFKQENNYIFGSLLSISADLFALNSNLLPFILLACYQQLTMN
jgi:hypothetical protein